MFLFAVLVFVFGVLPCLGVDVWGRLGLGAQGNDDGQGEEAGAKKGGQQSEGVALALEPLPTSVSPDHSNRKLETEVTQDRTLTLTQTQILL